MLKIMTRNSQGNISKLWQCLFSVAQPVMRGSQRHFKRNSLLQVQFGEVPSLDGPIPANRFADSRESLDSPGKAPDTFNFLRHVMRAILSVRPKCSHRCVSLKETT